jgi:hypothetical protein
MLSLLLVLAAGYAAAQFMTARRRERCPVAHNQLDCLHDDWLPGPRRCAACGWTPPPAGRGPQNPLGAQPRFLWDEQHPDPDLGDHVKRHRDVLAALRRYRLANAEVPEAWLRELGLIARRR